MADAPLSKIEKLARFHTHDPGVQYLAKVCEELRARLDECCPPDSPTPLRGPAAPSTDSKAGPLAPGADAKVDSEGK